MITFTANCPVCDEDVQARDMSFEATTVELDACKCIRDLGGLSFDVKKSTAYSWAVDRHSEGLRHRDGLVIFGGAR